MSVIRRNVDLSSYNYIIIWCILNIALWFLVVVAFGFSCSRNQMHFWRAAVTVRFLLYIVKFHTNSEKKNKVVKKYHILRKCAYGTHSPRDIFDISMLSDKPNEDTQDLYFDLKTSVMVILASSPILMFYSSLFFMRKFRRMSPRLGGQQCLG